MQISSINANSLNGVTNNTQQMKVVNTEEVQQKEAEKTTEENASAVSEQGDTVSISKQGQSMAKTYQAGSAYVSSSDQGYTDSKAATVSNAAASVGVTENTNTVNATSQASAAVSSGSSSSSSSSTTDLSSYTVMELKEMLQNGEISQTEYDEEIQSRNNTSSDSSDGAEETKAAENLAQENVQQATQDVQTMTNAQVTAAEENFNLQG